MDNSQLQNFHDRTDIDRWFRFAEFALALAKMSLEQLEHRIGQVTKVQADRLQHIDGPKTNLKALIEQLSNGTIEKLGDVGTTREFGLQGSRAGLQGFRGQASPSQEQAAKGSQC